MPRFDVPVKITTTGSVRVQAADVAQARDFAEACIDVIDAEFLFDVTDVELGPAPMSVLEIAGEPAEATTEDGE